MADKFTAAESIRRLALQYQAMVEAADALEAMGKLEQSTREAGAAKDQAEADRNAALADLKKAKDDVKAAQLKVVDIVARANDQSTAILQEADQKAQAIVDGGAVKANEMIAAAADTVQAQTNAIAGRVAQLTATKVGLEQDVAGLNQAAAAKVVEVEELEKRLAKVQAQIAKLLG